MKKDSIKYTRINSELLRAISTIVRLEVKDSRIDPMLSITGCEVTPDLKYCKIFVSILGDDEKKTENLSALKRASGFIRSRLASEVNLRNTPELKFVLDNSIEYGAHMSELIDKIHKDEI